MRMPNAKMLIGNHEYMMLNAIGHCKDAAEEKENANRREKRLWYRNGGTCLTAYERNGYHITRSQHVYHIASAIYHCKKTVHQSINRCTVFLN